MFKFLKNLLGRQNVIQDRSRINASFYDLERTDDAIDNHMRHATLASADVHAAHSVRETIRKKVRYEYANSSLLKGIAHTRANSVVGKGPRLVLPADASRLVKNESRNPATQKRREKKAKDIASSISRKINLWMREKDLGGKLRQTVKAKTVDGESFIAFIPLDDQDDIFPRVFDCDRVSNHWTYKRDETDWVDGIKYDERTGEPIAYRVMRYHPGGEYQKSAIGQLHVQGDEVFHQFPREYMFHFFRKDFGEQHRGVSELMAGLDIAAILRRSRKAIALANETAANITGVLQSKLDADEETITLPDSWEQIPIVQNTMLTLPNHLELNQMKSEHPNSNWESFREACVADIARALDMPLNRALGSSASYNFSSAMLDGLHDMLSCDIERDIIRRECLDKMFKLLIAYKIGTGFFTMLEELYLLSGGELPTPVWHFETEGNEVDPQKQMKGKEIAIKLGLTSITSLVAERGEDIDEHDAVLAKENGMTVDELRKARAAANFSIQEAPPEEESTDTNTDSERSNQGED